VGVVWVSVTGADPTLPGPVVRLLDYFVNNLFRFVNVIVNNLQGVVHFRLAFIVLSCHDQ